MPISLGNFSQAAQSLMGEYKAAVQTLEAQKTALEAENQDRQPRIEGKLEIKRTVTEALKWIAQREIEVQKAAGVTVLNAYREPSEHGVAGVEAKIASLAKTKESLTAQISVEEAKNSAGLGIMKWVKWQTIEDIPVLKAKLLQTTQEIARLSGILKEVAVQEAEAVLALKGTKKYRDAVQEEAKWNQENGEGVQLERILAAKDRALEGVRNCEVQIEKARANVEDTLKQGVTQLRDAESKHLLPSGNKKINGFTQGIITFLGKELKAFDAPAETDTELEANIQRAGTHEKDIQVLIQQRDVLSAQLIEAEKGRKERDTQLNGRVQGWKADMEVRKDALPALKGGSDPIGQQAIDLLRDKIQEAGDLRAIKDPLDFNRVFEQFVLPDAALTELDRQKDLLQAQWDELVADDERGRQTLTDEKLANTTTAIATSANYGRNSALTESGLVIQRLVRDREAAIDDALRISDQPTFLAQLGVLNAVLNTGKAALGAAVQRNEKLFAAWNVKEAARIAEVRDELAPRKATLQQEIQTLEARRGVQPPELQQLHTDLLKGMREELSGLQRVIGQVGHDDFANQKEALGKLTATKQELQSLFTAAVEARAAKHASFQARLASVQAQRDPFNEAAGVELEKVKESILAEDAKAAVAPVAEALAIAATAPPVAAALAIAATAPPVAADTAPKESLFKRILFAPFRLVKAVVWTFPVAVVRNVILAPARSLFRFIFKGQA